MSDRLQWLNRHALLLRHRLVRDAVQQEKYKLPFALKPLVTGDDMESADFVEVLFNAGKHREVCEFLAYCMHRRAAVWWGYRCLVTLLEEQEKVPPVVVDIADIGKPKPLTVPDWAKEPPEPTPEQLAPITELRAKVQAKSDELHKLVDDAMALVPPNIRKMFDTIYGAVDDMFKQEYGLTTRELVRKAAEQIDDPLFVVDPESPIFKAEAELKAQIEAMRQETVELVKSAMPAPDPAEVKQNSDDAMQAVYRWIVAPDEINTQAAMEIGNKCPDLPQGLLAMVAFWSYGNMMPTGDTVVQTPPGLAANGLGSVLLNAALAKGGTRKYAERYALYAQIGLDVLQGRDTWGESTGDKIPPHAAIGRENGKVETARQIMPDEQEKPKSGGYSRWVPGASQA
ncbi:MAG: hypothetical protein MJ025_02150 [Victivallaceae bacterium]|nr:hypothetical protein [Victivallaceae bacterium]